MNIKETLKALNKVITEKFTDEDFHVGDTLSLRLMRMGDETWYTLDDYNINKAEDDDLELAIQQELEDNALLDWQEHDSNITGFEIVDIDFDSNLGDGWVEVKLLGDNQKQESVKETSIKELVTLLEEYDNKYIDLDALTKYLESANIPVVEINEYYNGASVDIVLENDRHVVITVSTFSDGGYTLDIANCSSGMHTCIDEVDKVGFVNEVIRNVCQQTIDYKEPERERLELQTDFDNGVSVSCSDAATNFVNLKFLPVLDDKKVREDFKKLLKLCRDNKITVKGRKNAEERLAGYSEYLRDVEKYNAGVKELQEIWKKIVEDGIYSGYGDDERINDAHEKRFALEALRFHGNTPIYNYTSIANDIKDDLERIEYQVEKPDSTLYGRTTMIGF